MTCVWQRALFCSVNNLSDIHCAKKKFDAKTNELLLHNERLTSKSHHLQDRLDQLEKKNLRLIRRLTEQVEISLWKSSRRRRTIFIVRIFVCCPMVNDGSRRRIDFCFAKKFFFSKRNSITSTTIWRRYSLEIVHCECLSKNRNEKSRGTRNNSSNQQSENDRWNVSLCLSALLRRRDLKQSAEVLLGELNHHSTDEKVRDFLTSLLQAHPPR